MGFIYFDQLKRRYTTLKWLELNKPLENPLEVKPHESSSPPKLPENPPQPPVVSKSHTDSDQEPSPSERSDDTKNPPNCSSESFHSSDWSEKLLKISKPIFDSRAAPSWLCRKLVKPTWLDSLRTPTFALSTPSESTSCQKTSNCPDESEVNELKCE